MVTVQGYDGAAIRPPEQTAPEAEPVQNPDQKGMRGALARYADPVARERERGAWERAAAENYRADPNMILEQ